MITETPDPNRPQLWYQPAFRASDYMHCERLRLFYPSGKVEWASLWTEPEMKIFFYIWDEPCYITPGTFAPTTLTGAFEIAKEFDFRRGYKTMEFLGNL